MKLWQQILVKIVLAALVTAALCWLVLSTSGCKFVHKLQSSSQDSTQLHKHDSTHVQKSESKSTNENTWYREWMMVPPRKDSFVSKEVQQLQPIYQPTVYYREGGTSKKEEYHFNQDSFKSAIIDSLSSKSKQVDSKTESSVLSPWQMIIIIIAAFLFFWIVPSPSISFNKK